MHRMPQAGAQRANLPPRMSSFIGAVKGPHHNSPDNAGEVWCSLGGVELSLYGSGSTPERGSGIKRTFDPIAARNLAALLVRASEEVERMRMRPVNDGEEPSGL